MSLGSVDTREKFFNKTGKNAVKIFITLTIFTQFSKTIRLHIDGHLAFNAFAFLIAFVMALPLGYERITIEGKR